ncbi:MAG: tetratricopeptide repeat protein [Methylococcales bacterium]|nr:tetratricopeptide repeat protein [Methylococcales bacterium]
MEIYETEEEQVAAIKRWWKANGTSTIAGSAIGFALILGWNFWQDYQKEQASQASNMYEQMLTSIDEGHNEVAQNMSQKITDQYGSTPYAGYGQLLVAKAKVDQNDIEAAKTIFNDLMRNSTSAEIKNIARIRLIRLLYSTGKNEQGLQLISEADKSSAKGFLPSYDELKGDLYVALNRFGEARTAYQSALRSGGTSPTLQFKLDDISSTADVTGS